MSSETEPRGGIDKVTAALAAAQGELKPAPKNANNPHFNSTYSDLPALWATARPVLAKHGLAVVQGFEPSEKGTVAVWTAIYHTSGQSLSGGTLVLPIGNRETAQAVGSAITYARRYGLAAALGLVGDDEDDDGNAASAPTPGTSASPQPKPRQTDPTRRPAQADAPADLAAQVRRLAKAVHGEGTDAYIAQVLKALGDKIQKTFDRPEDLPAIELARWVDKLTAQNHAQLDRSIP